MNWLEGRNVHRSHLMTEHGAHSSTLDAFRPEHQNQCLSSGFRRMCGFSIHPHERSCWVGSIFVPDFTFEDDVCFTARVAVWHESIHGHFRVCFIEHKRTCVFSVEPTQSNACTKVLPADVFFHPGFVDGKSEPVGHVVSEGHASPIRYMNIRTSEASSVFQMCSKDVLF